MTVSTARELISGLGPLPPDPDRRSPFLVGLAQAMWYTADGRPYEELVAASGLGFRFAARPDSPLEEWGEALADLQLETLGRATGLRLEYVELADPRIAIDEPQRAWQLISPSIAQALEERRPTLARGGWPGDVRCRWGVITGWASDGLPAGHVYRPEAAGPADAEPMAGPPWQVVLLGAEFARPAAGRMAREVVAAGAAALGRDGEVTRVGQRWTTGPAALEIWADVVARDDEAARPEHRRLAADFRSRRRFAGRYLQQTAGLQLGRVRPARDVGRRVAELGEALAPWCAASWPAEGAAGLADALRALAARERALAADLEGLLEGV